jgi:Flp pilus assembly protein TadD
MQAAALKPESSKIQNHLGIAYERTGEQAAALAAFERAVELDCDNAAASANLASLLQERRRGVKASAPKP